MIAAALSCLAPTALTSDIITRDRFVADLLAHVFGDRVYVYATDDSGNDGKYWNGNDWRLYSSADLDQWRDHGTVFSVRGFRWASGLAWAPNAVEHQGRYYLFLPVDRTRIGVAIGDRPEGPFRDAIGAPLVDAARDRNTGPEPIDPHVFVDRDGSAFLYFGTRTPKIVALSRDLTRFRDLRDN